MPLGQPKPLPPSAHVPIIIVDPVRGPITPDVWQQWLNSVQTILQSLAAANFGSLVNAANDAAAAAGGVPVGGLYRNGGAVQIRLV